MASNGISSWSTTAANNVLANTGVNWDEGQAPSTVNDSARQILADLATWYGNFGPSLLENFSFTCSVGSSALTIALKRRDGSDPSTDQPVRIAFRNVTAGTGDYSILKVTAATSLVVSSGSTLGMTSAVLARLWIVGFNDAGTFRLGIYNPVGSASIIAPNDDQLNSSTAEGGAGGADSAQTYYTGSAVSAKAMRILGYIECTEATAGTWATAPSKIQLYGPGILLPQTVYWNFASGDTSLSNTGSFFDGPSVAQPTSGIWDVTATITLTDSTGAANFQVKINDGTTVFSSGAIRSAAASGAQSITVSAIVTNPAGNLRISAKDSSSTSGSILFNSSGSSKDSFIIAKRIG